MLIYIDKIAHGFNCRYFPYKIVLDRAKHKNLAIIFTYKSTGFNWHTFRYRLYIEQNTLREGAWED